MLKIRRSRNRLIFNMWIPIPGKDGLYIEMEPWLQWKLLLWQPPAVPAMTTKLSLWNPLSFGKRQTNTAQEYDKGLFNTLKIKNNANKDMTYF